MEENKKSLELKKPVVLNVEDIMQVFRVNKSKAYLLIREVNVKSSRSFIRGKCFTVDLERYLNIELDVYLKLN